MSNKDFRFQYYKNLGIDSVERPLENMLKQGASPLATAGTLFMRQLRNLCEKSIPAKVRCRVWKILLQYYGVYAENWIPVDAWREDMFDDLLQAAYTCHHTVDSDRGGGGGGDGSMRSRGYGEGSGSGSGSGEQQESELLIGHCVQLFERLHGLQEEMKRAECNRCREDDEWDRDRQQHQLHASASIQAQDPHMASYFRQFDAVYGTNILIDPFRKRKTQKSYRRLSTQNVDHDTSMGGNGGILLRQRQQKHREMNQKLSIARVLIHVFLEDDLKQKAVHGTTPLSPVSNDDSLMTPDFESHIMSSPSSSLPTTHQQQQQQQQQQQPDMRELVQRHYKAISASYWCWDKCLTNLVNSYTGPDNVPTSTGSPLTTRRTNGLNTKWNEAVRHMINEMNYLCMEQLPDVYNVLYASRVRRSGDSIEQQRQMLDDIFESWFGSLFSKFLPLSSATKVFDYLFINNFESMIYIGLSFLAHMRRHLVRCKDSFVEVCDQLNCINECDMESVLAESKRLRKILQQNRNVLIARKIN